MDLTLSLSEGGTPQFTRLPVGSIIAWHKNPAATADRPGPELATKPPAGWLECKGQELPADSPLRDTGATHLPDLNHPGLFLRGAMTSGKPQESTMVMKAGGAGFLAYPILKNGDGNVLFSGSENETSRIHTAVDMNTMPAYNGTANGVKLRPVNMSVVWIIRVK